MNVVSVSDPDTAASEAAALITAAGRKAIAARGEFSLAMSGGATPWRMLELLAGSELDWSRTLLFQADERIAPSGSPERNLTHMVLALPFALQASIRPMPVGTDDPERAMRQYGESLPDRLDLIHLGLGADGHTASLIPGDPVLEIRDRPVAATATVYDGTRRMTLTYPAINNAREILFLVTGDAKRTALRRLLDGDRGIPAARVKNERISVVADHAAAGDGGSR
ncbi:MAG: 6-phosphogluconolactonase [Solirubrobacterales bacterium]|nr:6-phosphogluconolactonase [Solirubrobacterales bacterium]